MSKPEVAQPFGNTGTALAPGLIHRGQAGQLGHQVGLSVAHHHAVEAGLEHRQVVEGVAEGVELVIANSVAGPKGGGAFGAPRRGP